MGVIIPEVISYDKESLEKAEKEYVAKHKVEPQKGDPEVIQRATEIFKDKLYGLSTKYKKQQTSMIFDEIKDDVEEPKKDKYPEPTIPRFSPRPKKEGYEIPELGSFDNEPVENNLASKSNGYEINTLETYNVPTVPKVPKKPSEKVEIPDLGQKEIKIDYEDLKKASVGNKKHKKNPVVVTLSAIMALILAGSITLGAVKLNTNSNVKEGSIGTFDVSDYHDFEWTDPDHYNTWYYFGAMGVEIVSQAFENDEYSNLDIYDALAMIFGDEAYHIANDENYYGDPSKWAYKDAEYDGDKKGWATWMYESMKEEAELRGLELPDTLREFLEQRNLDKYKYSFNSLTGSTRISLIDSLSEEEQSYYRTTGGMLENLTVESKTLQYKNGKKGVSK